MNTVELERLRKLEIRIREIVESMGLMTTDIVFEIVPAQRVLEGMSYRFPVNFSHWSFGRDYERNRTIYDHSGQGIPYEQVWNFDTPKAFLVETNPFALNVLILAHVYGHVDFFLANNYTNRGRSFGDIAAETRLAADRFLKYQDRYGLAHVERIIDAAMAIQWQQDPDPFAEEVPEEEIREHLIAVERANLERRQTLGDEFGKPPTQEEIKKIEQRLRFLTIKTPPQAEYDLLRYIRDHSPGQLRPWMKDILSIVRSQARSLAPSIRTKMLNEGWATYVHVHVMRQLFEEGLLTKEEHGVFNRFHSNLLSENKYAMGWYRVGYYLYEYIKEQWDKGRFGRDFEECEDPYIRSKWDTGANLGTDKILQVRAHFSDRLSVERFFSDEFIREQNLYIYERQVDPATKEAIDVIVENDPAVIRANLKNSLTLYGSSVTYVEDGNYNDNRELYLVHTFSGFELDPRYEQGTLAHVFVLWGRPVHLQTIEFSGDSDKKTLLPILDSFDGTKHSSKKL